jgi:hypothetical protein
MPKPAIILVALVALAIAACGKNSNVTPTPAPSASFTPPPGIKTATVSVTILGSPAPNIPVAESTPKSEKNPIPGTPFETKNTGAHGNVKFENLTPGKTYCYVATLGSSQQASACAPWQVWQYQTIPLGS